MKYMLIMRDTQEAVDASLEVDFEEIINAMGAYNDSLITAGVFVTAEGLSPAARRATILAMSIPAAAVRRNSRRTRRAASHKGVSP